MPDREKVIKGIDICLKRFHCGEDCPYHDNCGIGCMEQLSEDAIALLKEQEALSVDTKKKVLADRQCEVSPHHYERKGFCPKCHQEVKLILNRNYCGFCGQEIKWND